MLQKHEVRPLAEKIKTELTSLGFNAEIQHSGSAYGLSSYISSITHPNGWSIREVRVSDHSCGVRKGDLLTLVYTYEHVGELLAIARDLAARPEADVVAAMRQREKRHAERLKVEHENKIRKIARKIIAGEKINDLNRQHLIQFIETNNKATYGKTEGRGNKL